MEILVLGGDLRYLEIIENLSSKYNVDVVGYKNTYISSKIKNIGIDDVNISKYDVIIFPVNGVMEKNQINCRFNYTPIKVPTDLLVDSKENVLIFSGINTPALSEMLKAANRSCTFLMNDQNVITENAVPTVEGIIADVIENTEITLNDSDVLVFGYGNIGKLLVKYLGMLGAKVSVSIISEQDKLELDEFGINNFYSFDHDSLIRKIHATDIIINTVPKTVIEEDDIKYINEKAYVLDVSSHPHGIDAEVLDEFFIKNNLYLGIPGKVAPKTAGKILTKKINEVMKGK